MGTEVDSSDLERLRDSADVRDLIRRREGLVARTRRSWLIAATVMLALGAGLLSIVFTERHFPDREYVYLSKGIIHEDESDFVFAGLRLDEPKMNILVGPDSGCDDSEPGECIAGAPVRKVEDPIMKRVNPTYLYLSETRGDYFVVEVEGGRRVYRFDGSRAIKPILNTHVFHALAVMLIMVGLAGFYLARRW